jgi:hypothetical protein
MTTLREQAYRDFPGWAVQAVVKIYEERTGSPGTISAQSIRNRSPVAIWADRPMCGDHIQILLNGPSRTTLTFTAAC